jgi:ribonuclease HI
MLSREISHRPHLLVYKCKQMCSDLLEDGVEVELMWILAYVGLEGNETVDKRARHAAFNDAVFDKLLSLVDFQGLARSFLLR